jgi:hypothetical protein
MRKYKLLIATPIHEVGEIVFILDRLHCQDAILISSIDQEKRWWISVPFPLSSRLKSIKLNTNIEIL